MLEHLDSDGKGRSPSGELVYKTGRKVPKPGKVRPALPAWYLNNSTQSVLEGRGCFQEATGVAAHEQVDHVRLQG